MSRLGSKAWCPFWNRIEVIEEIPKPQPVMVTEYNIANYRCPGCPKEVVASDAECPSEGWFGNNIIAQTALLKYEDRLPHRKIQDALRRLHGLNMSPATVVDLTRRAAEVVQSEYDAILNKIRCAPIMIQGHNCMRWRETICQIHKAIAAMLGTHTSGIEGPSWEVRGSNSLHKALKVLYESLTTALETDPPRRAPALDRDRVLLREGPEIHWQYPQRIRVLVHFHH